MTRWQTSEMFFVVWGFLKILYLLSKIFLSDFQEDGVDKVSAWLTRLSGSCCTVSPKHCLKWATVFCSFTKPQQCNFTRILQIFLKDSLGEKSAKHMFNNSTNRQQLLQITLSERNPQQCIANFNNVLELCRSPLVSETQLVEEH